jgi:hypothetical protein
VAGLSSRFAASRRTLKNEWQLRGKALSALEVCRLKPSVGNRARQGFRQPRKRKTIRKFVACVNRCVLGIRPGLKSRQPGSNVST